MGKKHCQIQSIWGKNTILLFVITPPTPGKFPTCLSNHTVSGTNTQHWARSGTIPGLWESHIIVYKTTPPRGSSFHLENQKQLIIHAPKGRFLSSAHLCNLSLPRILEKAHDSTVTETSHVLSSSTGDPWVMPWPPLYFIHFRVSLWNRGAGEWNKSLYKKYVKAYVIKRVPYR